MGVGRMTPQEVKTGLDLFRTALQHEQSERLGELVDESLRTAARHREERAERDRLEREAEEREQRLAYFRELEREDAHRLAERRRLEEEARVERENERELQERAQREADLRRAENMRAHEWQA